MMSSMPDPEVNKILRLTNKTDFDFTPAMGAMFGGLHYPLPAGKSMLAPKPMAKLLAKHLARQVFIKKAPIRDEKEVDGKGTDRALWTEEDIERTAQRFLSEEYEEQKVEPMNEAQIMAAKIAQLNKEFPPVMAVGDKVYTAPEPSGAVTATVTTTSGYADKSDVIAALEKKGITKFDRRWNKAKLEELLK